MIYNVLRWINGVALHWFYRDIRITGTERIPTRAPLLIAANHQNALVDSLIVAWVVPRRIAMTAKATLTENPLIALLFRILGVVPLRRVSDEAGKTNGASPDRSRNTEAFREILKLLEQRRAVLIFQKVRAIMRSVSSHSRQAWQDSHYEPGMSVPSRELRSCRSDSYSRTRAYLVPPLEHVSGNRSKWTRGRQQTMLP